MSTNYFLFFPGLCGMNGLLASDLMLDFVEMTSWLVMTAKCIMAALKLSIIKTPLIIAKNCARFCKTAGYGIIEEAFWRATPLLPDKNHIAVGAVLVLLMKRFQLLLTKILPYAAVFAVIFAVMFFGTQNQRSNNTKPITANFDDNNFTVTSDQVSEFYIVANIANTVDLPSTASISENYVTINKIYETTGTTNTDWKTNRHWRFRSQYRSGSDAYGGAGRYAREYHR